MPRKAVTQPIYSQYKRQIDGIVELVNYNYTKAAKIVSWLYGGGSAEHWRKVLSSKKKTGMIPHEIKELLGKLEAK